MVPPYSALSAQLYARIMGGLFMSILVAVDENGEYVIAGENAPQRAVCPLCGAELYLTSRNGVYYYALMPMRVHKCSECRNLDARNGIPNLGKLCLENMWNRLFLPVMPQGKSSSNSNGSGSRVSGPRDMSKINVNTLPMLHAQGLLSSKDTSIGNIMLSNITINPYYAHRLLEETVGRRILQGKPLMAMDHKKVIRFTIYVATDKYGRKINSFLTADLFFETQEVYECVKKKLFRVEKKSNTICRKFDRIAVLADWRQAPLGHCESCCKHLRWSCSNGTSNWKCKGYIRANISVASQVYPFNTPAKGNP